MNGHKDEIRHFMIGAEHFIIPFFSAPLFLEERAVWNFASRYVGLI